MMNYAAPVSNSMMNAMSVDVEDYFQVTAFSARIQRDQWDSIPGRVEANTDRVLELFDQHRIHATFFMLGWVAERYPQLVSRIIQAGHELASHGYAHELATRQTRAQFLQDAEWCKKLLEDMSGLPVLGFRAASFSVGQNNQWVFELLQQAGYRYSSSIYPVHHDLYGMPGAPRFAFHPVAGPGLLEVPVTTVRLRNLVLPCGGGGYFRLMPYIWSRWAMHKVNLQEQKPCVFYFHPWEMDPLQPRLSGLDLKTRIRHYVNLDCMRERLNRLLVDFHWDRMDRVYLAAEGGSA